ncbi:MAG: PIN domain-containing protein [Planctomycetia bacterium]|nr:PIN domain-containing protein [Planctomycetia bacterium]
MILVDTGPLIALCDPRDSRHAESVAQLQALSRGTFALCEPVITEAWFLLEAAALRRRLDALVRDVPFPAWVPAKPDPFRREVLAWLARYSDQEPDWADGCLVLASAHLRAAKVWTYDSEFTAKWRRPDGTRVPLAT